MKKPPPRSSANSIASLDVLDMSGPVLRHSVKHCAPVALKLIYAPGFCLMQFNKLALDTGCGVSPAHSGKILRVLEVVDFAWVELHVMASVAMLSIEKCFTEKGNT